MDNVTALLILVGALFLYSFLYIIFIFFLELSRCRLEDLLEDSE